MSAAIILPGGERVMLADWVDDKLYDTISFSDMKACSYGLIKRDVA